MSTRTQVSVRASVCVSLGSVLRGGPAGSLGDSVFTSPRNSQTHVFRDIICFFIRAISSSNYHQIYHFGGLSSIPTSPLFHAGFPVTNSPDFCLLENVFLFFGFFNGESGRPFFFFFFFFLQDFIFIFTEGKGRRKRERNISVWLPLKCPLLGTWPATQACVLIGNQTHNPLDRRPALNLLSHTSQG